MTDIAKYGSLCTSMTVREHRASREQFINAIINKNSWTIFGRQNILDVSGHFWLISDFGLDRILEMSESYTTTTYPIGENGGHSVSGEHSGSGVFSKTIRCGYFVAL